MHVLKRMKMTRIAATKEALDTAEWPDGTLVMRTAADEVLLSPVVENPSLSDEYAIVLQDGAWAGAWFQPAELLAFLERNCEWELPRERPAFAQGAVADVATKLWFEEEKILLIVPAPYAAEMEERMEA